MSGERGRIFDRIYFFGLQVSATAADVIELFIYLEEPCHVCQILLTLSHGGDESSFPGMIDVRTGCTLDELKLVLEVIVLTVLLQ